MRTRLPSEQLRRLSHSPWKGASTARKNLIVQKAVLNSWILYWYLMPCIGDIQLNNLPLFLLIRDCVYFFNDYVNHSYTVVLFPGVTRPPLLQLKPDDSSVTLWDKVRRTKKAGPVNLVDTKKCVQVELHDTAGVEKNVFYIQKVCTGHKSPIV